MKLTMKKLFTLMAVVVMAFTLAAPAFAYGIRPEETDGVLLNVHGNGQVSPNRNVNLYTNLNSKDQTWYETTRVSGRTVMATALDTSYALNILHTNNNCDIYEYANNFTNGKSDSDVYWLNGRIHLTDWSDFTWRIVK